MKKLALLAAILVAVGLAWSEKAWCAVAGTPHDITSLSPDDADYGVCSACHIPHKSAGKRLWPQDMSGSETGIGEVGALCWYCHAPGTGLAVDGRTQYPFWHTTDNPDVHKMGKASLPDGSTLIDTTLPYLSATSTKAMQCTSCHNVHDNTLANAFLQDDIDALCARCHPGRQFTNGASVVTQNTWDNEGGIHYGDGNPGSHPVGTDVFGDNSTHDIDGSGTAQADSPIDTTVIGIVDYDANAANGDYQLGPKLIDGGTTWADGNGIGCVTCHLVHGRDTAAGSYAVNYAFPDLLAVEQLEASGHANGAGDAANYLCEACHRGIPATGYNGSLFPNPGIATRYTHPVDDYLETSNVGVTGLPAGWPEGIGAGDPDLICESCHMPHPYAATLAGNTQTNPYAASGSHILRDDEATLCERCHGTTGVANHHPVGTGLMTSRFSGTQTDGSVIGDGNADLTCTDCHNGSGAHNWSAQGAVGLDADWLPWDNGRADDTTADGPNAQADTSRTCMECHTAAAVAGDKHFSPTRGTAGGRHANAEFQATGDASHFLGAVDLTGWAPGPAGPADPTTHFNTSKWPGGGWSRFGGTDTTSGAEFVCESCHDVEPGKNVAGSSLLLMDYNEATVEADSLLCQFCHSHKGTAQGEPHPMTGDAIGRAETTRNLITGAGSFANAAGAPGGDTTYPAANQMNCDSCHQVHDADGSSGTYILEGSGGASVSTGTPAGTISMYGGTTTFAAAEYDGTEGLGAKLEYQPFCNLCHASGQ